MSEAATFKDPSLSDGIYGDLKSRLMLGHYLPGDRLSMRKLAVEFGTSAMPVREALKRLASERVIESAAARAFNVPDLDDGRASDLFMLRALLEGAAVEAAYPKLGPDTLNRLEALCDRMDAHLRLCDFTAYMIDNHRFHFLIYRTADNSDLVSMIEQLWMQTGPSLHRGLMRSGGIGTGWNADHKRLLTALRAGDAAALAGIMRADVEWGAELYRA